MDRRLSSFSMGNVKAAPVGAAQVRGRGIRRGSVRWVACQWWGSPVTYNHMVVRGLSEVAADRVFHALADGTRREIIVRVIHGDQSVSALAQHFPMSFAAVQKHVAVLERAELVTKHRRGRERVVRPNLATLREAADLLAAYERLWRERIAGIERILAEDRDDEDREGADPCQS